MHAADLRHRHVALVDDAEHVLGEVVNQGVRRLARRAPVEVARVVLDAVAEPHGLEHLEVIGGALREALGLEELIGRLELGHAALELLADGLERAADLGPLGHIVRRRPDRDGVELADDLARDVVDLGDELDLVAKEAHAQRVLGVRGEHIHGVPPHTEGPAREVVVVAVVLDVDERLDEVVALERFVLRDVGCEPRVVLRAADAVDAAHRGDHNYVAAGKKARSGLVAELLDLLVDGGVLLDIGVGLRDVGLGLVVVVVRDEVDDGVVREELAHLGGDLRGQGLVRLHDERGAVQGLDRLCHGKGLARARDAHEGLVAKPILDPLRELGDGLGLVARGLEGRDDAQRLARALAPEAAQLAAESLVRHIYLPLADKRL